ncbi:MULTISPECIES: UDP-2,3-diacylglucosamine diphosphatase [Tenacibaculum]|uniref:UDP-2,3-diacylglucosamine diphosphatase n=1 Tax=Tenacibaculum TaxID=104267 RepID=UPI000898A6B9|nr:MULTISPECIES: UDP-2,3-diacylglucosamine diphosphatase [unclassified Tenacibaculum]RBW56734.1 UDP-2,3-diacylglucosamine diphosphatase [Tenacibaculum sp. E3R01]SEE56225.1 UDP-2,3-diacylglucosamine pyrophosphatase LpxH [Tenacibaculum sp. MAR_2010_89]
MKKNKKRKLDIVVISDVHLGTFGCRATELNNYLKTINPKTIILNGDIIDIWQFNKRYFPKPHMKVIKQLMSFITSGTKVYYITGNHDEMLRKFKGFRLGSFEIVNKVILDIDGKKGWFFHGDVFDVTMQHSKWLAKLGGIGYDTLIMINTAVNWISEKLGYGKLSFSKKIKNSVKSAVKFINNFETIASDIAIEESYDYVVCGHIHQPEIKEIENNNGKTLYLNSGDWIENLTALEYHDKKWNLYEYEKDETAKSIHLNYKIKDLELIETENDNTKLFEELLIEFNLNKNVK